MLLRINETIGLPNFTRTTLHSLLRKHMGFEYVKRSRNSALIERKEIIIWRRNYLKAIKKYRSESRPIYYMDETWINAEECTCNTWLEKLGTSCRNVSSKDFSTGPINPSRKGKLLIVVHIGGVDGFVEGGLLCFESKKNINDYNDEMNGEIFLKWLGNVLPRLKKNAVIIMDDAPHHSVKIDKAPTSSTRKTDIIKWLQDKGEIINKPMVIAELMSIVCRIKPLYEKYVVDEFVKQHNMNVLRLPPYHYELNPIIMAWSVVKNHIKMNNITYKIPDVKRLLEEGTKKVDRIMWKAFISHAINEEKKFWDFDFIIDDMLEEQALAVTYASDTSDESC